MVDEGQSARNAWPAWARYAFDERAGILEYCANLPRADAERKAEAAVLLEMAQRAAGKHATAAK